MPRNLAERLRSKPNKSAFIAEAVREKLSQEDTRRREQALAAAYKAASEEDKALREDWDTVAGDAVA